MDGKVAPAEQMAALTETVAEIAARQYGVISVSQLRRIGVTEDAIRAGALAGRLHRVHRGVYAVGYPWLSTEGQCLAAVLAVGRGPGAEAGSVLDYWGAALSHRGAAWLWQLLPAPGGPIDVVAPRRSGRAKRLGIRIHRPRSLSPTDVTLRRGIPVTTPRRTISDLRVTTSANRPGALPRGELRKAVRQANVLGLPIGEEGGIDRGDDGGIDRGEEGGVDRTRSDLERDFLRLCRRHEIPRPEVNVRVGPHLVDFLWRERRLVVETDGYVYHRGQIAFQDDCARDLELRRRGYEVLRLSEQQVNEEPGGVAEALLSLLSECDEG